MCMCKHQVSVQEYCPKACCAHVPACICTHWYIFFSSEALRASWVKWPHSIECAQWIRISTSTTPSSVRLDPLKLNSVQQRRTLVDTRGGDSRTTWGEEQSTRQACASCSLAKHSSQCSCMEKGATCHESQCWRRTTDRRQVSDSREQHRIAIRCRMVNSVEHNQRHTLSLKASRGSTRFPCASPRMRANATTSGAPN